MGTQLEEGEKVDPEILRNLDFLLNYEVVKGEPSWEMLKTFPTVIFKKPDTFPEKFNAEDVLEGDDKK